MALCAWSPVYRRVAQDHLQIGNAQGRDMRFNAEAQPILMTSTTVPERVNELTLDIGRSFNATTGGGRSISEISVNFIVLWARRVSLNVTPNF